MGHASRKKVINFLLVFAFIKEDQVSYQTVRNSCFAFVLNAFTEQGLSGNILRQ